MVHYARAPGAMDIAMYATIAGLGKIQYHPSSHFAVQEGSRNYNLVFSLDLPSPFTEVEMIRTKGSETGFTVDKKGVADSYRLNCTLRLTKSVLDRGEEAAMQLFRQWLQSDHTKGLITDVRDSTQFIELFPPLMLSRFQKLGKFLGRTIVVCGLFPEGQLVHNQLLIKISLTTPHTQSQEYLDGLAAILQT